MKNDYETGIVTESNDTNVKLVMKRSEACARCGLCQAGPGGKEMFLYAQNKCGASPGDVVRIELNGGIFLKAVLIMYGLPLLFMMSGFVTGMLLSRVFVYINPELLSFLTGASFLIAGYHVIKKNEERLPKKKYEPAAVEVLKKL